VREILSTYSYPGNVRELQNIMERAVALAEADTLTVDDLPPDLQEYSGADPGHWVTMEDRERDYMSKVLKFTSRNLTETARILAIPRTTLWRKMKKYGLSRP